MEWSQLVATHLQLESNQMITFPRPSTGTLHPLPKPQPERTQSTALGLASQLVSLKLIKQKVKNERMKNLVETTPIHKKPASHNLCDKPKGVTLHLDFDAELQQHMNDQVAVEVAMPLMEIITTQ